MERDLIEYIANNVTTHWNNGKVGHFFNMDNSNSQFRFRETNENATRYLIGDFHTDELRALPILTCGFVGWLIKHWGRDIQAINEEYLLIRLRMYNDEHKNDDDADLRNLDKEFYSTHKAKEEQWVKQSEAIFEYLPDGDIQRIRGKIARFFRYLDSKIATYEINPHWAGLNSNELLNLGICDFIKYIHNSKLTEFEIKKWINYNCTTDDELLLFYCELESYTYELDKNEAGSLEYVKHLIQQKNPKLFEHYNTEQSQQPPHFTRQFTKEEQKKLFDGLTSGDFLPKAQETDFDNFCCIFRVKNYADSGKSFTPLQWQKKLALFAYFVDKACEKYGLKHGEKRELKPFAAGFNVENKVITTKQITAAINDYKKTGQLPIDHGKIDNILK
jgi:hypothetical protein